MCNYEQKSNKTQVLNGGERLPMLGLCLGVDLVQVSVSKL